MTPQFSGGNQITLLQSGQGFFPALIAAIDGASREVHLETYIFTDDVIGRLVAAALCRAVRRGVAVRLLVDGFGSAGFAAGLGADLVRAGVALLVYRPDVPFFTAAHWRRSHLRRLHRKLAVIDGSTGFVGGINIVDDWDDLHHRGQTPPRFDYAVRVSGPLVEQMHGAVHRLWTLVAWSTLGHRKLRLSRAGARLDKVAPAGTMQAALVIRDNLRHRSDIEDAYLEAIAQAKQEILIANAYFLPGRRFMRALIEAAQRGVRVTLLLQGKVEYWLQHQATQFLYARLIEAGIVIHEYRRSFLHAKVAVVDGHWATVGSSNIDPFSLLLAREANVIIDDGAFALALEASLEAAIQSGAVAISAGGPHRWWHQFQGRLAYLLVRLATSLSRPDGGGDY